MKKFIWKTILLILPILTLLILVNYFGDEASLFDDSYEKEMVKIIASGQNVTNFNNYNERQFQIELIANEHIHPNLIVIGSSRTMLIGSEFFPGNTFFNNSVAGACLEDIISLYQLYKDKNKLPQKIIIGIDPWLFNENNDQKAWQQSLSPYYFKFLNSKKEEYHNYSKYKQLVSFSYFQSSFSKFIKAIKGVSKPQATNEEYNVSFTKLADGSLVYSKRHRNFSPMEINDRIKSYLAGGIYAVEFYNDISDRLLNEFQQLITDMSKNNIEIEFFLVPYPPLVYDKIENGYPMVLKTEEIITDFAKVNGIKLYGSYNPYKLGMDERFFYDGMHCNSNGIKNLIQMDK